MPEKGDKYDSGTNSEGMKQVEEESYLKLRLRIVGRRRNRSRSCQSRMRRIGINAKRTRKWSSVRYRGELR